MSKFIGQRVRKVRGRGNIGITGRVVGTFFIPAGRYPADAFPFWSMTTYLPKDTDIQIKMDSSWTSIAGFMEPANSISSGIADDWEPIIPEGQQSVVSWEECLWQPTKAEEKIRESSTV